MAAPEIVSAAAFSVLYARGGYSAGSMMTTR